MTNHPLYPLALKLRPELNKVDGIARLQAFSEVLTVLYLAPFAIAGFSWLIVLSVRSSFTGNIFLPLLLAVGILITNVQTAAVYVEIGLQRKLTLTSSLGSVLYWAGALLWGPIILWLSLLADLITNLYTSFQLRRMHQNAFWGPLTNYFQSLAALLGVLLALWVYNVSGGTIPIDAPTGKDWIPALITIAISSIFPGLAMLPTFYTISIMAGSKSVLSGSVRFIFSVVAFILIPAPFGIPVALLFVKAGAFPFVVMVLGVTFVNSLAHYLSLTNQRNMQQSREMSELEKLGEEIIQSPPDGSLLEEILRKRLASMFSNPLDIVVVWIFDDAHLPGYSDHYHALHLVHPRDSLAPDDSVWETLRKSDGHFVLLKNQIPSGFKSAYGDAILVKINSVAPTPGGETPACIGGIYLLMNKTTARTVDSLDTVLALASQTASALYRVQIYKESLVAEKMSQELAFAGDIQSKFLPESVPALEGWSLAASLIPARQTSGDFYDFIQFSKDKLGLLIADVADKGTGAALYMALSRTLLRTFARQYPDAPAEVFRMANDRLFEDSRTDQFVTVFYGVLDLSSGRFEYCNAGHNPTFLLRSGNGYEPEVLKRTGSALGAMEGLAWTSASVTLNKGDILLFYTDGVVEAQNENDEFFGEKRLTQSAKKNETSSAKAIHAQIMEDLQIFVGKAAQFDDITMMTLKRE